MHACMGIQIEAMSLLPQRFFESLIMTRNFAIVHLKINRNKMSLHECKYTCNAQKLLFKLIRNNIKL